MTLMGFGVRGERSSGVCVAFVSRLDLIRSRAGPASQANASSSESGWARVHVHGWEAQKLALGVSSSRSHLVSGLSVGRCPEKNPRGDRCVPWVSSRAR